VGVVEATGPNARMNLDLRVAQSGAATGTPVEADAGRRLLVRALLTFAIIVTVVWLVAAPSTPALIAVISAVIAVIGWSDGPDHDPSA
jgi:hypothetical protein